MPIAVVETIAALLGTAVLGGFTLAGLRMWLRYREARLGIERGAAGDGVSEAVEDLRDQVAALRGEVSDLHERIDFAERLLTRGRAGPDGGAG